MGSTLHIKKYKSVVKKLRFYVGNDSLPIKSISLDFIKGMKII